MFTLDALLRTQATDRPEQTALIFGDTVLSYADLHRRTDQLARYLRSKGIEEGSRVGILAKNTHAFYETLFACAKVGAVLVTFNWRLSPRELAAILADSEAGLLLVDEEFLPNLPDECAECVTTGSDYEAALAPHAFEADLLVDNSFRSRGSSPVLQLYSSGTTGLPKGIVITHENLSKTPKNAVRLFGMSADTVNLVVAPLFHVGGLGYGLHGFMVGGTTVVSAAADPATLCQLIERWGITHSFMVPSMIQQLIDSEEIQDTEISTLERIAFGGAPVSDALYRRGTAALGCELTAVYGMTETSGTVVADYPGLSEEGGPRRPADACGKLLPWIGEVAIFSPETGEPCAVGETGEIWVRSPQVVDGYWKRPEETASTFRADGWFRTGDAAYIDADGFVFLKDRIKDMIISGGENVFPAEVEAVLAELPDVREVAVIGVPSEKWGETVKAVIVSRADAALDEAQVMAYARENLAHFKCPTSVDFVGELPHNSSGKILKAELRAQFSQSAQSQVV